jgi:dTDP-N-acetylfucosamine:lipid II N-acetylfucosaminyltransferase
MKEIYTKNYHFMIDDKFVDDFICDIESISTNNNYIFTFNKPAKYVKSSLGINAPYYSIELENEIKKIRKQDKVFIHWFSPQLMDVLYLIPNETKIYLFFWGADFLEPPSFSHSKNPINRFLYDPLTFKVIKKKYKHELYVLLKDRLLKAIYSGNVKNQIATIWSNIKFYIDVKSKQKYLNGIKQRKDFLLRIEAIFHWNNFDIETLKELYNIELKQIYFHYNIGITSINQIRGISSNQELTIWLGNSDTETNNHLDFLNDLSHFFKHENIKIICPLNYGNKKYSDVIARYGKKKFGERFIALQDYIDRDTYYSMMNQVDVAVMPHNRGQAGGNVIAFLKKGVKVYMKPQSSIFKYYKSHGLNIFTIENFYNSSFDELKTRLLDKQKEDNLKILKRTIDNEENRVVNLNKILLDE